jgi:hypothetical protein
LWVVLLGLFWCGCASIRVFFGSCTFFFAL